jgi:hypothetical protein
MAAMAIFIGARPFRLWEDLYMRDFIAAATDGLYIPPTRTRIGGELLDQQYTAVHTQVEALLQSQDKLNFVLDESPNISSRRIVNISVVIPGYGSIYLANKDTGHQILNTGSLQTGS